MQIRLEQFDDAIASFRTALRMQDDHVPALYNLSLLYCDRGRYLDALPLLETALRTEPSNVPVLGQLSLALIRTSESRLALPYLERARTLEPMNGRCLMLTAMAYSAGGDDGAAAVWVERAIGLVSDGLVPGELIRNYLSQPELRRLGERDPDLMTRLQQALVAAETVKTESN